MRNRGVLLLALAIAAVLAAGSIFALVNAGDDSGPKVDALPSPTATASETTSPTASPTPTETASSSPEPTATATAAPTSTRTSTSRPTSSTTTYAYPRPTRRYDGLQMTVDASNEGDGDADPLDYTVTVHATDGDGTIYFNGLTWGDGTSQPAAANPQHCKSYPPLTSPPGPYDPQNDSKTYVFHHHYPTLNQSYTITVKVASVNVDCRPHGPAREDQHLSVTVHPTAV